MPKRRIKVSEYYEWVEDMKAMSHVEGHKVRSETTQFSGKILVGVQMSDV